VISCRDLEEEELEGSARYLVAVVEELGPS
jgi:hypothetical protein